MIFGFAAATLAVFSLALFASAAVEVKKEGRIGEGGSLSSSVFVIVLTAGMSVLFGTMSYMSFSGSM